MMSHSRRSATARLRIPGRALFFQRRELPSLYERSRLNGIFERRGRRASEEAFGCDTGRRPRIRGNQRRRNFQRLIMKSRVLFAFGFRSGSRHPKGYRRFRTFPRFRLIRRNARYRYESRRRHRNGRPQEGVRRKSGFPRFSRRGEGEYRAFRMDIMSGGAYQGGLVRFEGHDSHPAVFREIDSWRRFPSSGKIGSLECEGRKAPRLNQFVLIRRNERPCHYREHSSDRTPCWFVRNTGRPAFQWQESRSG